MKIEEIEIPDQWCNDLVDLQKRDPSSVIAGGALRDLYCSKAPKDVDFFTKEMPDWKMPVGSGIDYVGMQYVDVIVTYLRQPLPYNVIRVTGCDSTAQLIESFDFGICQIAFDGKQIIKSQAFLWDLKYGRFTLRHTDRIERSKTRYERINQRYNWPMEIADANT